MKLIKKSRKPILGIIIIFLLVASGITSMILFKGISKYQCKICLSNNFFGLKGNFEEKEELIWSSWSKCSVSNKASRRHVKDDHSISETKSCGKKYYALLCI